MVRNAIGRFCERFQAVGNSFEIVPGKHKIASRTLYPMAHREFTHAPHLAFLPITEKQALQMLAI